MHRIQHTYYRTFRGPYKIYMLGSAIAAFLVGILLLMELIRSEFGMVASVALSGFLITTILLMILFLGRLLLIVDDISYRLSFEAALKRADYQVSNLFMEGSAANPSLQLLNLKILLLCQPVRILELGSGQTTKVISCYIQKHSESYALTLEQNETWFQLLQSEITHDYRHLELKHVSFSCEGQELSTEWFDVSAEFENLQFNYILIDGPVCPPGTKFGRSGLLQHLPKILAKTFIIVFDDAERLAEIETISLVKKMLVSHGIPYAYFELHGRKSQSIFCSPNLGFLESV